MEYERPFKILRRKPENYIIDKNETNYNVSNDRFKAAYLQGDPTNIYFPPIQSNDKSLRITIPYPIISSHVAGV